MDINKDELLTKFKSTIKSEVSVIAYDTWISSLGIRAINKNHIIFEAKSDPQKDFLESKLGDLIVNTLKYITNRECTFSIIDLSSEEKMGFQEDEFDVEEAPKAINSKILKNQQTLNPKYTFETFVVGDNNDFAHAAALAVGNKPGQEYNPLYIYGGVGLGKTHLMHAIGHRIIENNPNANVLYVTSEKFTNQFINALKDYKTEMFRNIYRTIDVLLIDDIQFIAGKDKIQEEFFHTFETLRNDGKQIIISSDKLPKDIELLEDRLKSRLEWGLSADIGAPKYETRFAILKKKAQDDGIIVDDFILSDIATKVDSNIRELEGVYKKIVAYSSLAHSPITIELAEKTINEFQYEKNKTISCDYIKETVSKYFSIKKEDLSSTKRSNDIAFPRQIAMYLCREVAGMSFPQIGKDFGNRDHSTVMHGYNKIANEIKEKNSTKLIVESVKNIITEEKN